MPNFLIQGRGAVSRSKLGLERGPDDARNIPLISPLCPMTIAPAC
jgi:hypothetical protein